MTLGMGSGCCFLQIAEDFAELLRLAGQLRG
jgi:hypothetical protein